MTEKKRITLTVEVDPEYEHTVKDKMAMAVNIMEEYIAPLNLDDWHIDTDTIHYIDDAVVFQGDKALAIIGNISDGFRFYGPFDDFDAASEWSDTNMDNAWIATLGRPV